MPYSRKAKFYHKRQKHPSLFSMFRDVPFSHVKYAGKKYRKWHRKRSGARAIVGKLKTSGKWATQSILIPKRVPKT